MAQQEKSNIKLADIILLVTVLLAAAFSLTFSLVLKTVAKTVVIEVDGYEHSRYNLSSFKTEETVTISTEHGMNTVVMDSSGVYVSKADCPDKIDVKKGKITKVGDSIVCLPNRLIIYIEGESDVDATSY